MFSSVIYSKCSCRIAYRFQFPCRLSFVRKLKFHFSKNDHTTTNLLSFGHRRHFSISSTSLQRISDLEREKIQGIEVDLKPDSVEIFKHAVRSVRPRQMIEKVLDFKAAKSALTVHNRTYHLDKNVFVVGFGKAVLGMARVVENVLGDHIRAGVVSVPKGLPGQLAESENFDAMLSPNSKIEMYEGAGDNRIDENTFNAAKAIDKLVSNLVDSDIVIVLCSGGGSVLCSYPQPPISLDELKETVHILSLSAWGSVKEINTVRKNIEVLKGGGLAVQAKPAKVISLILSSVIGDSMGLIAGGPTHPTQSSPQQCLEIFQRHGITNKIPSSVKRYLEKEIKTGDLAGPQKKNTAGARAAFEEVWSRVQNIVVGNNSIACDAAAEKATDLGYLPIILTKMLSGEAHQIGALYATLSKFIMLCFDRKASAEPNADLASLELELVAGGIKKQWMNQIIKLVDTAHNSNKDICVISGGETFVQVDGTGVGGKNMELALAAAIQMKHVFQDEKFGSETRMVLLSADTDGYDGMTQMSGAVVDQCFLSDVEESGLEMNQYLKNNDSFSLFSKVNGGKNLINTQLTGTNVMDIIILLVKKPTD